MQFLFERLATTMTASTGQAEPFDLPAAVAAQIGRLVSARATACGDEIDLLDFGMPQVVDMALNSRTQLEQYARQLRRLIAHFEPRLAHPDVSLEPRPDSLQPYRLVVTGTLDCAPDIQTFRFDLPAH